MNHFMSIFHKLFSIDGGRAKLSVCFPVTTGERSLPISQRDLLPVSLWCDDGSYSRVAGAYDDIFPGEGAERVISLNKIARGVSATYWLEIFPFIPGVYWCICWRPLTPDEAASIPFFLRSIFFQDNLGMLTSKSGDLVFLKIQPAHRNGIFPPYSPIGKPFDLDYAERQMRNYGLQRIVI
jgi:hypothetical protein